MLPSTPRVTTSSSPGEILKDAAETDRLEDEQYGEKRGDELPPQLSPSRAGGVGCARLSVASMRKRAAEAKPIPRSRHERLSQSKHRLEEELAVECAANAAYEAYRARGVMKDGRRFGAPPNLMSHRTRRREGST